MPGLRDAMIGVTPALARYATELISQARRSGILDTPERFGSFLGQMHVESGGYTRTTESLNYAADRLVPLFGRSRITPAEAWAYGRVDNAVRTRTGSRDHDRPANQEWLANRLYGGAWGAENLGNTEPGDGWKYRGRGLKQLTGRDNYARFSQAHTGADALVYQPDRLSALPEAVASAVWFWNSRSLSPLADAADIEALTRRVNGGLNGLAERKRWTTIYIRCVRDGLRT